MKQLRRVLITGCDGQVGSLLHRCKPNWADVRALNRSHLDLMSEMQIRESVSNFAPDVIINAAAYTAVDKAESEPDLAKSINAKAVGVMADAASKIGAKLVHYSTDFVFDGHNSVPYLPTAQRNPLSVYGATKAQGEDLIAQKMKESDYLILRTAWVYAPGGRNFVATILKLLQNHPVLRVISDQVGTPTAAQNIADATWKSLEHDIYGIHHFTDAGVASWYDFACAIRLSAQRYGVIKTSPHVQPINSSEYPQAATRPKFGVLDKQSFLNATGIVPEHWHSALERNWFHNV